MEGGTGGKRRKERRGGKGREGEGTGREKKKKDFYNKIRQHPSEPKP